MKKLVFYFIVFVMTFACTNKNKSQQLELLVYSGAGLTNVVTELAEIYKAENDIDIKLNFASSGTLARQIEQGAQPSVYISANEKWVDYLINVDLVVPESKEKVVGTSMAVIVPADSETDTITFLDHFPAQFKGRLSIGDPKHVPAGDYAWKAIESGGYADALTDRILPAKDVRSALMVVELGEVEMGIVYKTDALKSKKVKIVSIVPDELHPPIGFYASILKNKNNEQTKLFYNFLTSKEAKDIWIKHGFNIE
ncbi:molybdate ABC transporter substrate-binding protein [Draconibacterium sp. IB214405]|uniref:molybdate ABC transporter substrate-binding protein n=1 Tax=Draconibacterium sp. IB214405 TaxID=3097352 RepID=UPI002A122D1F|nr:molybdate ABC transporter substrate-binding protein [Draconibacterium sp. IB214405]MDX8341298.1 molybdate ABC transporter substrate-binding protein [Draconibacterium sp. IB214405]